MQIALIPGSFDPVTYGHLDIIERTCRHFDEVIVATIRNPQKTQALFSLEEREEMLREVTSHLNGIRIDFFKGLLVDFAREHGVTAIVKGLRAVSDFDYELQMAQMNHKLSAIDLDLTASDKKDVKYTMTQTVVPMNAPRRIFRFDFFKGLLVDFAREHGVTAIVKGLRAVSDFDYELQMAQMNHKLSGIDTLFIPTSPKHSFLSSSLVREVARFGGDVSSMVPEPVQRRLKEKFSE